jgi:ribonuclease HI
MRILNKNDTTNNNAYYHALIESSHAKNTHMLNEIAMFTNSKLIYKHVLGEYKVKDKHIVSLHSMTRDI